MLTSHVGKMTKFEYRRAISRWLEETRHFRDYTFKSAKEFGKVNEVGIHVDVSDGHFEWELDNALDTFCRDGYSEIFIYT